MRDEWGRILAGADEVEDAGEVDVAGDDVLDERNFFSVVRTGLDGQVVNAGRNFVAVGGGEEDGEGPRPDDLEHGFAGEKHPGQDHPDEVHGGPAGENGGGGGTDGTAWVVGGDSVCCGHGVYQANGAGGWIAALPVPNGASAVAGMPNAKAAVITSVNGIFVKN